MKVERGVARVVKPSQPASASIPRLLPLSNVDLLLPPVHVKVLYAFDGPSPPVSLLEQGLADAISVYREWAGRLGKDQHGRAAIELNDEGVAFAEAEADATIQELMPFHPHPHLQELLPVIQGVPELLLIQVTKPSCGGMIVGVAWHHHVADGEAAIGFMNAWASIVKGLPLSSEPLHDRSALMARNPPQPTYDHTEYMKPLTKPDSEASQTPPLAMKKFHFSPEMLQKIKQEAANEDGSFYTTFESLSSHLWRSITVARGITGEVQTTVSIAMNGRKQLVDNGLPPNYFGNVVFQAYPQCTAQELLKKPLSFVAGLMNAAIKKVDSDYIRSLLDFAEMRQNKPLMEISSKTVLTPNLIVSSWVQFPLYQLDFGWGNPAFAGLPQSPLEGLIFLTISYTKDGSVDANVGLFAPDMAKLEEIYDQTL